MNLLRTAIGFLILTLISLTAFSQDIIVKKNGDEIESKVLEITLEVVKYKKYDNLEGPTISILKTEIFMIKYENGTKDVFGLDEKEKKEERESGYEPVDYKRIESEKDKVTVTYSKVEYPHVERDRGIYHHIKVNPLLIFSGDIPIYYERRLGKFFSVEFGIGITQFDYMYEIGLLNDYISDIERTPKIGYSIRSSGKFYPSKYTRALDEMYFGMTLKYKRYNTELVQCGSSNIPDFSEYRNLLDVLLSGGYVFYISDMVLFDVYAGVGIRSRTVFRGECENNGPVGIVVNPSLQKRVLPNLSLGVKFGFGL